MMPRSEILVVDRRAKPGGHWNDAYDFVRLHQPSLYYGVGLGAAVQSALFSLGRVAAAGGGRGRPLLQTPNTLLLGEGDIMLHCQILHCS